MVSGQFLPGCSFAVGMVCVCGGGGCNEPCAMGIVVCLGMGIYCVHLLYGGWAVVVRTHHTATPTQPLQQIGMGSGEWGICCRGCVGIAVWWVCTTTAHPPYSKCTQ